MADFFRDFFCCSSLLPVLSLESVMADGNDKVGSYHDMSDAPDIALLKKQDAARLRHWVTSLPTDLADVAKAILRGETQASLARRLKLTEPAISKRVKRLARRGRLDLAGMEASILLH